MKSIEEFKYEELKKLELLVGSTRLASGVVLLQSIFSKNNDLVGLYLASVLGVAISYSLYDKIHTNAVKKDPDVINLNSISDEMLNNLKEYAESIEVSSALEAYYILNDLLKNGYLCYKKDLGFELSNKNRYKELYISDSLTLNNHGVCRHKSPFLKRYLELLGYESDVCVGLSDIYVPIFNTEDIPDNKYTNKQLIMYKNVCDFVNKPFDPSKYGRIQLKEGSHMITRVNDSGRTGYLDLTLGCIYIPGEDYFVSNGVEIFKEIEYATAKANSHREYSQIEVLPSFTCEEIDLARVKASRKIKDTKDMQEQFHKDNVSMLECAEESYQRIIKKHF